MEYTKDIVLNVRYGRKIGLRDKKIVKQIVNLYKDNKFIINILAVTTILIVIDLYMVSNFVNLLLTL